MRRILILLPFPLLACGREPPSPSDGALPQPSSAQNAD